MRYQNILLIAAAVALANARATNYENPPATEVTITDVKEFPEVPAQDDTPAEVDTVNDNTNDDANDDVTDDADIVEDIDDDAYATDEVNDESDDHSQEVPGKHCIIM